MWIGWDAVDAKKITGLDAHEFEELLGVLVRVELRDRWGNDGYSVEGPAPEHRQDGGRDGFVTLTTAASVTAKDYCERYRLPFAFMRDMGAGARLAVSCKTGDSWEKSATDDTAKGGARVIPVLRAGGELLVATSEALPGAPPRAGKSSEKPKREDPAATDTYANGFRKALAGGYAVRAEEHGLSSVELEARIRLVDASELALWLRGRTPSVELSKSLRQKLGLRQSTTLLNFSDWSEEHGRDRATTAFVDDSARQQWRDDIGAHFDAASDSPALVVVGPPGVGKTRLVIEAIKRAGCEARARVTNDSTRFDELLESDLLASAPDGIFVVDDCSYERAGGVARKFLRAARDEDGRASAARLIVIVPHGSQPGDEPLSIDRRIDVAPLDATARVELVRSELATTADDPRVQQIVATTEGFPWFAHLVAKEVREGAPAPDSSTKAARLALASQAEQRHVLSRARALLAISLAGSPRWRDLGDDDQTRLARAVGLRDRAELEGLLLDCAGRGVLRTPPRWYVTPSILEREVWRVVTGPSLPDGPGRVLERMRTHYPEGVGPFLERMTELGLSLAELRDAADASVAQLRSLARVADVAAPGVGPTLVFCAKHAPRETSRLLLRLVEAASGDELKTERRARRPLMNALLAMLRRADFSILEEALFRLRLAENESYTNNASRVWSWLFLPWLDYTGAPFAERLSTLAARCTTGSDGARVSAVQGLVDALDTRTFVVESGVEPPARVPSDEALAALRACWSLLLQCARRAASEVANTAQRGVVRNLRAAVDAGVLDPLEEDLVAVIEALPEHHRATLRVDIGLTLALSEDGATVRPLWRRLELHSRPQSFVQRLRDRLGAARTALRHTDRAVVPDDEGLLRQGLVGPQPLFAEHLDVFEERGAAHVGSFMTLVGRFDEDALMLAPLVERARGGATYLVSTYCVGQWDAGRTERVDAWLRAWQHDDGLVNAVVETVARIGPDDAWLGVVTALIRRSRVSPDTLRYLVNGKWERASAPAQRELFGALIASGERLAVLVVVERMGDADAPLDSDDAAVLLRAFELAARAPLYGGEGWAFQQAGLRLLAAGLAGPVCAAVVRAAAQDDSPGSDVWRLIEACASRHPAALWAALEPVLTNDPGASSLFPRLAWHDVVARLPAEAVMRWVGSDTARASEVAHATRVGDDLPLIARSLVARFGADSLPAKELAATISSVVRPVPSRAGFAAKQQARALRWASEEQGEVRAWAALLASELERQRTREREAEAQAAATESARRRVGT